jgi:hypothetical protein
MTVANLWTVLDEASCGWKDMEEVWDMGSGVRLWRRWSPDARVIQTHHSYMK